MSTPAALAEPRCDAQAYHGIRHCTNTVEPVSVLVIDNRNPAVRFEAALSLGPDGECNSVNSIGGDLPDDDNDGVPDPSKCPYPYPFDKLSSMLSRHKSDGAVAVIYADFFAAFHDAVLGNGPLALPALRRALTRFAAGGASTRA